MIAYTITITLSACPYASLPTLLLLGVELPDDATGTGAYLHRHNQNRNAIATSTLQTDSSNSHPDCTAYDVGVPLRSLLTLRGEEARESALGHTTAE